MRERTLLWLVAIGVGLVSGGLFVAAYPSLFALSGARGALAAAAGWALAAAAGASLASFAARKIRAWSLWDTAAWGLGAVASARWLGLALVPSSEDLALSGAGLGLWLLFGTAVSVALSWRTSTPEASAVSIPARAVIIWALAYGMFWSTILPFALYGFNALPPPLAASLLGLTQVLVVAALGAASAHVGSCAPRQQIAALLIANAAFASSNPFSSTAVSTFQALVSEPASAMNAVRMLILVSLSSLLVWGGLLFGVPMIALRWRRLQREGSAAP